MAKRKMLYHPDEIKEKIQASQLITFLKTYVNTGLDTGHQEVQPARVQAALGLLRKVVPDLSAVEHSGSVDTFTTFLQSIPKTPDASPARVEAPQDAQRVEQSSKNTTLQ